MVHIEFDYTTWKEWEVCISECKNIVKGAYSIFVFPFYSIVLRFQVSCKWLEKVIAEIPAPFSSSISHYIYFIRYLVVDTKYFSCLKLYGNYSWVILVWWNTECLHCRRNSHLLSYTSHFCCGYQGINKAETLGNCNLTV